MTVVVVSVVAGVRVCFVAWVPDNSLLTMCNVLIMFNWFCLQSLSPLNLNQETSTFETEFLEALTAFLADTLLV